MIQKLLSAIIITCILTTLYIPVSADIKTFEDFEYKINEDGKSVTITFCKPSDKKSITIPRKIENLPVTDI